MHSTLHTCHLIAMHFATFAGSDIKALDPIVELKLAKRKMGGLGGESMQIVHY